MTYSPHSARNSSIQHSDHVPPSFIIGDSVQYTIPQRPVWYNGGTMTYIHVWKPPTKSVNITETMAAAASICRIPPAGVQLCIQLSYFLNQAPNEPNSPQNTTAYGHRSPRRSASLSASIFDGKYVVIPSWSSSLLACLWCVEALWH